MLAAPVSSPQKPFLSLFSAQMAIATPNALLVGQHFDWSDFPAVEDSDSYDNRPSPPNSPTSVHYDHVDSPFQVETEFKVVRQSQTPVSNTRTPTSSLLPSQRHLLELEESTPKRTCSHNRKVSFSSVLQVRTHPLVLGDHPCCTGGMALTCGWEHEALEILDLQVHEQVSAKRRNSQLRLDYPTRRDRLQDSTGLTGFQLLQQEYNLVCGQDNDSSDSSTAAPLGLHHAPSVPRALARSCELI